MGQLTLQRLALLVVLSCVTSQARDVPVKAGTTSSASGEQETAINFPNVEEEEQPSYAAAVQGLTTRVRGNKGTSTTPTTTTTTTTTTETTSTSPPGVATNEVEDTRVSYELASDAVHSVATRLHSLVDPSGNRNYLVSPLSVALLTSQMLLAARGDSERRLRILLTGLRAPRTSTSNDNQEIPDLELHTQLGGLLKSLQSEGQGQNASYHLKAASAFFLNTDLKVKETFQKAVRELYDSAFLRLNFSGDPGQALKDVNHWAELNTNGLIPFIYGSPLPRHTAVILINSVYFRSEWESPFDPEMTVGGIFRLNTTHQIKVKNMRGQFEVNFADHKELKCRMMVLPYKSPDVNMYLVLPNKDVEDMKDFATKLSSSNITTLIKALSSYSVTVVLPKMSLSATYSLKEPIMKYKPQQNPKNDPKPRINTRLNRRNRTSTTSTTVTPSTTSSTKTPSSSTTRRTTTPTTTRPTVKPPKPLTSRPPTRPNNNNNNGNNNNGNKNKPWFDLSGASTDERFRVNEILHQITLEVSEVGTEAAAISSGSVDYSGDTKVFKADRPFLFFIRHEPSLVNLFYAVIMDPTNGSYD